MMDCAALLDLAARLHASRDVCLEASGWHIERAACGANGLIFRAWGDDLDLAIKISARDQRDRSGREFAALRALRRAGLAVSAEALHLARRPPRLPGDAVIMTWLPGTALREPPPVEDQRGWLAMLDAMTCVYRAVPFAEGVGIRAAVMPIAQPADLLAALARRAVRLLRHRPVEPISHRALFDLLHRAARTVPWRWRIAPPRCLIRCDANPGNFLFDGDSVRLVDWENSGWADPAFDLGDLCAQPACAHLPADHLDWLMHQAGDRLGDPPFAERAAVYARLMLVFWVIMLTQQLVAPAARLAGVRQFRREDIEAKRLATWERARAAWPTL